MAQGRVVRIPVTIASGQTTSTILDAWNTYGSSAGIMVYSPTGLAETITMQVSPGPVNGTYTWHTLQEGSGTLTDLAVPAAGKATYYDRAVIANAIRLSSATAAAADRVFWATIQSLYDGT
jgi:hypothetical protein